jgi:hypothetical protein
MSTVGDSLKELAGQAEKKGVTLGLENTFIGRGQHAL